MSEREGLLLELAKALRDTDAALNLCGACDLGKPRNCCDSCVINHAAYRLVAMGQSIATLEREKVALLAERANLQGIIKQLSGGIESLQQLWRSACSTIQGQDAEIAKLRQRVESSGAEVTNGN